MITPAKKNSLDFENYEMDITDLEFVNIISQMRDEPTLVDGGNQNIRTKEVATLAECLQANPAKCSAQQIMQV